MKPRQMSVSFKEAMVRDSRKGLPELFHLFLKGYKAEAITGGFPNWIHSPMCSSTLNLTG